jgi:hypothetical protein
MHPESLTIITITFITITFITITITPQEIQHAKQLEEQRAKELEEQKAREAEAAAKAAAQAAEAAEAAKIAAESAHKHLREASVIPPPPRDRIESDAPPPPPPAKKLCRAMYDYLGGHRADEITFHLNEVIEVLDNSDEAGWWYGQLHGKAGYFPGNYVKLL